MRILFVYYTHKPGGFCRRLYRLMAALSARGHAVSYACLDAPPKHVASGIEWIRIPFFMSSRRGLLFWGAFTAWLPWWLLFRCVRSKPERIVPFGAYYSAVSLLAGKALAIPRIVFLRSLTFEIDRITGKPHWLRCVTGLVDKVGIVSADVVVCMTEAMRTAVERFTGKKLRCVEILVNDLPVPGAEAMQSSAPDAKRLRLVTAGVLDARKSVEVLLGAFAQMAPHTRERVQLTVVGDGPLREELALQARSLGLSNVQFTGWVENITPYLVQSDVLLHPALHEGVPNVVLEALSVDLPVLVSDIPEHAEILSSGLCRVPPADALSWAKAITNLVENEGMSALEAACRESAQKLRFDWDEAASQIVTASR